MSEIAGGSACPPDDAGVELVPVAMLLDWFFPYAAGVANALACRGSRVAVVTRDHGLELGVEGDSTGAKRAMLDARVELLVMRGRQRDPRSISDLVRLRRDLARLRPRVLHVQDHADWRLYLLQRSLPGVPSIVTVHDVVRHQGERERPGVSLPLRTRVQRAVRSEAGAFIVHGRRLARQVKEQEWYKGQPVHVIPHGRLPYADAVTPLPAAHTLLFFGRLEYYKGLDLLIRAAETASSRVPDLRVVIAGHGADEDRCRAMVTMPGLFEWRAEYIPHEETAALFREASVVVLPYRDASQSGVVPMAFANGRAVISTDVGALSEVVQDGVNGLVVGEPSVAAIADAVARVFTERGLLERLSAGAAATIATGPLSPSRIAASHQRAYARLVLAAQRATRRVARS